MDTTQYTFLPKYSFPDQQCGHHLRICQKQTCPGLSRPTEPAPALLKGCTHKWFALESRRHSQPQCVHMNIYVNTNTQLLIVQMTDAYKATRMNTYREMKAIRLTTLGASLICLWGRMWQDWDLNTQGTTHANQEPRRTWEPLSVFQLRVWTWGWRDGSAVKTTRGLQRTWAQLLTSSTGVRALCDSGSRGIQCPPQVPDAFTRTGQTHLENNSTKSRLS